MYLSANVLFSILENADHLVGDVRRGKLHTQTAENIRVPENTRSIVEIKFGVL